MIIFKAAAWYALTDEELQEILSCDSEPILKAYILGVFRAACRLWKFVMPVEARSVFQNEVFSSFDCFSKVAGPPRHDNWTANL